MSVATAVPTVRLVRRRTAVPSPSARSVTIRPATALDADAIHDLVSEHVEEGRLLPRDPGEVFVHSHRFIVAVDGDTVVACADLAPLSRTVAEVRSLVVRGDARSSGTGRRIIDELVRTATLAGYEKLCAFTHAPSYFVQLGFSLVPHEWLPEKIETNCRTCSQFRGCGQYAVMLALTRTRHSCVPLGSLHG